MKRLLTVIVLLLSFLFSCAQVRKEFNFSNGQKAFVVSTDGIIYGVENEVGKVLIPAEWKNIIVSGNLVYCEDLLNNAKKSCALYDYTGNCIHKSLKYKDISIKKINKKISFYWYDDGEYFAYDNIGNFIHHYKIFKDEMGFESIKDLISGQIVVPSGIYTEVSYKGDYFEVSYGFTKGILNLDGKTLIAPKQYRSITPDGKYETRGFIAYYYRGDSGKCAYYNKSGRCIFTPEEYTRITKLNNDYYEVIKDGRALVVDSFNKLIISTDYNRLSANQDEQGKWYYLTTLGNGKGKLDANGNILESPNPTVTQTKKTFANNTYFIVRNKKGLYGINSSSNDVIIPDEYESILFPTKVCDGFILRKNGYEGFADLKGKIIIPCNKYSYIRTEKDCFVVGKKDKLGLCDKNGTLTVNPSFDHIYEYEGKIHAHLGLMQGIIDINGRVMVPFEYTNIYWDEKDHYYHVKLFGKEGICDSIGNIIIPPIYSKINNNLGFFLSADDITVDGPFKFVFDVYDGKYQGIFSPDGVMLFPPTLYEHVWIGNGQYQTDFKSDWYICGWNDEDVNHKFYYDFKGNLLYERTSDSKEFYDLRYDMYREYINNNYAQVIEFGKKATNLRKDGLSYFYMAIAYYHQDKIKDALNATNQCIQYSKSDYVTTGARKMREEFQQILERKRQRATQIWLGVLSTMFNVAATIVQTNNAIKIHNSYISKPLQNQFQYTRNTSMDYLLDPRVAMMQVQKQEWNEYLQTTNGGTTMSFDQWRIMQGQAIMETSNSNSGNLQSNSDNKILSVSNNNSNVGLGGRDCKICYGTGDCRTCGGKGYYYGDLGFTTPLDCPNCKNHNGKCSFCGGSGIR